jgi:hypothetical protein
MAFGLAALCCNQNGSNNTAIGACALRCNTTGSNNIAVGCWALQFNTSGINNIGLGFDALGTNFCGSDNIALGACALRNNTTNSNIAIGGAALQQNTNGTNNTAIGRSAGTSNTNGSNNVFLGCGASGATATSNNTITFGDSSITTLRAQVTTITALSDARDKTDIEDIPLGLQLIRDLRPVKFTWNTRDGSRVGVKSAGFIAQEVLEVSNRYNLQDWLHLVLEDNPEKLEATVANVFPVLIRAVQELAESNDQLNQRVTALELALTAKGV